MKKQLLQTALLITVFACSKPEVEEQKSAQSKPNIIYILADDLGYADIGAYGSQKIETPNIDALAKEGMMFTQHYTGAPVCAPARYMLMTGRHAGHSYIRGNDPWRERGEGDVWDFEQMENDSTLEGQRPLPEGTKLFPSQLQKAGYKTGMIGKWGLGAPQTNSIPTKMGFDFFYGYNCQRQAHTYYPVHLYRNENREYLDNELVVPGTKIPKGADPNDPSSYKEFTQQDYAPDLMYEEMSKFISANKENPFFFYWASPIPHMALQAPQRWVDYYVDKFGEEEPYLGQAGYFPHKNPRAAYAAMVSYLDENVGKLVQQLKDEGIYDNTLIIFTSDNGPTYNGGTDTKWFESANPFPNESGRIKGHVYEGGIRIPMIASWPGKIKAGSKSELISSHIDMAQTFADLLGYQAIENDGISILPTLLGEGEQQEHDFLYWEFPESGGQLAIRMGDWKVVRQHLKDKKEPTLELYNLKNDIREENNVAELNPEIIAKADSIFRIAHQESELPMFRIPLLENGFTAEK
ncbi:arylsulfatase [Algoriphagus machipongonensis]|uniref:Arylsulfatase n=1 Tax=Algoriphagus machipongonensis TaxID=388413 RepID=A3I1P7_9BACT|nr:arylsulfatase [Algoriphagus machipongonensis]EAZ79713.1 arylsulfatase [Algoriphagus machipongonensis]